MVKKESEYSKKLRDPRWQKKRLKILERDTFACQQCFDNESTLHIHHRRYLKGKDPWDYPEYLFITLCENCHYTEKEQWNKCERILTDILKERFLAQDLYSLASGFHNVKMPYPSNVFADILQWFLESDEKVKEICDLYFKDLSKILKEKKNAKN